MMSDRAKSYFRDVGDFHAKFGLPVLGSVPPRLLPHDLFAFRHGFHVEEVLEFAEANGWVPDGPRRPLVETKDCEPDLAKAADALVDAVYVLLGTAHKMGIDFDAHWDLVHGKNMEKVRAASAEDSASNTGRGHAMDVVKPPGWTPPNHWPIIQQTTFEYQAMNNLDTSGLRTTHDHQEPV